jgi:hypothetical protein
MLPFQNDISVIYPAVNALAVNWSFTNIFHGMGLEELFFWDLCF